MATVNIGAFGLDMDTLSVSALLDFAFYSTNSTYFELYDDPNNYFYLGGSGISLNTTLGTVTGGTIHEIEYAYSGAIIYQVTNANFSAVSFYNYVLNGNTTGAFALVLAGADKCNGSNVGDRLYAYNGNDVVNGNGGADILYGMVGNDTLKGGSGNDKLYGGDGVDTLNGGTGHDILNGGTGADKFVFNAAATAANSDTISGFTHLSDKIQLENSVFTALGAAGALAGAAFWVGPAAHDASDRIIYDSATGKLYYDSDGSLAAHAQVLLATLSAHPTVSVADFQVI